MRILFVNKFYPPETVGGAEVILSTLAVELARRGHEVHVATTTSQDHAQHEQMDGVTITRLPLRNLYWHHQAHRQPALKRLLWHVVDSYNPLMSAALERIVERISPQLISFHNLSGFSASAWSVARKRKTPAVQVLHDYYHLCPKSQMFRAGESCARTCQSCKAFRIGRSRASDGLQGVIGVSQAVLDTHLEQGLFSNVPIRSVVRNARAFQVSPRQSHGTRAQRFGFIGSIGEWKGVRRLLESFRRVTQRPDCAHLELLVAGTGDTEYLAGLEREFASQRVRFLGKMRAEEFYAQIDVSVVPSIWNDPLPTVIAEALLSGVPVIGATRGGIAEMVMDGINGVLFDPDQPETLDAALIRLATEPGLLAKYGAVARTSAARFSDLDRMVTEHLRVYQHARQYA